MQLTYWTEHAKKASKNSFGVRFLEDDFDWLTLSFYGEEQILTKWISQMHRFPIYAIIELMDSDAFRKQFDKELQAAKINWLEKKRFTNQYGTTHIVYKILLADMHQIKVFFPRWLTYYSTLTDLHVFSFLDFPLKEIVRSAEMIKLDISLEEVETIFQLTNGCELDIITIYNMYRDVDKLTKTFPSTCNNIEVITSED